MAATIICDKKSYDKIKENLIRTMRSNLELIDKELQDLNIMDLSNGLLVEFPVGEIYGEVEQYTKDVVDTFIELKSLYPSIDVEGEVYYFGNASDEMEGTYFRASKTDREFLLLNRWQKCAVCGKVFDKSVVYNSSQWDLGEGTCCCLCTPTCMIEYLLDKNKKGVEPNGDCSESLDAWENDEDVKKVIWKLFKDRYEDYKKELLKDKAYIAKLLEKEDGLNKTRQKSALKLWNSLMGEDSIEPQKKMESVKKPGAKVKFLTEESSNMIGNPIGTKNDPKGIRIYNVKSESDCIDIPSTLKGKGVVSVHINGQFCPNVQKIVVGEGIKCVEGIKLKELKELVIPDSVIKSSFIGCEKIQNKDGLIISNNKLCGTKWPLRYYISYNPFKSRGLESNFDCSKYFEGVFHAPCESIIAFDTLPIISYVGERKENEDNSINLSNVEIGDTVSFGRFPQSAEGKLKEIKWYVLNKTDGHALLLSIKDLSIVPFDTGEYSMGAIPWHKSKIRKWLNTLFFEFSFSEDERKIIDEYDTFEKDGADECIDHVFLLSVDEVDRYCEAVRGLKLKHTDYSYARQSWNKTCVSDWWLRTKSPDKDAMLVVDIDGSIKAKNAEHCLRPAIWVKIG